MKLIEVDMFSLEIQGCEYALIFRTNVVKGDSETIDNEFIGRDFALRRYWVMERTFFFNS